MSEIVAVGTYVHGRRVKCWCGCNTTYVITNRQPDTATDLRLTCRRGTVIGVQIPLGWD